MKRLFVLVTLCFVLLAGCNERADSPEKLPEQKNNFGTQAVRISSNATSDGKTSEKDEPASQPDSADVQASGSSDEDNDASAQADAAPSSAPDSDVPASASEVHADVEVKEKMFMAQINDIYLNAEDYIGKSIKYEGIFDSYTWEEGGQSYYSVIRYGPGCCGNDGNVGFEVVWDGDYPEKNDWVEAVGTLEFYDENGWQFLRLNLSSLTVLPVRGEEYVSQ